MRHDLGVAIVICQHQHLLRVVLRFLYCVPNIERELSIDNIRTKSKILQEL